MSTTSHSKSPTPNSDSTQSSPEGWRNRIIGHSEVDPTELLANPRNWRIHPQNQQEALEGRLSEVGWVDEIIVNQRTGFVVDGHLRVALALRREQTSLPVKYVDLSEAEEQLVLASLDPIAAMAATDVEKLDELLREASAQDEQARKFLADLAHNSGITAGVFEVKMEDATQEFASGEQFKAGNYLFTVILPEREDSTEIRSELLDFCQSRDLKWNVQRR